MPSSVPAAFNQPTGRTRTNSWKADIRVEQTLVYGWNKRIRFGYINCPDYFLTDKSQVLTGYGHDFMVDAYPVSQTTVLAWDAGGAYNGAARIYQVDGYFQVTGYTPQSGTIDLERIPFTKIITNEVDALGYLSGGDDLPTLAETGWSAQRLSFSLTRTYSCPMIEYLSGGAIWQELPGPGAGRMITSASIPGSEPRLVSDAHGDTPINHNGLEFPFLQASASGLYHGIPRGASNPSTYDTYCPFTAAEIEALYAAAPRFSLGSTAVYAPLWTNGSPNPDVPDWGSIHIGPVAAGQARTYSDTISGGGNPPHTITVIANLLCCDGSPETEPTMVTLAVGDQIARPLPTSELSAHPMQQTNYGATSGYSITRTLGGYFVRRQNAAGTAITYDYSPAGKTDGQQFAIDNGGGGFGDRDYTVSGSLYEESGGYAPGSLAARLWAPFPCLKVETPASIDYWGAPWKVGATTVLSSPLPWMGTVTTGTGAGAGGTPPVTTPAGSANLRVTTDGANNLRLAVPVATGGTTVGGTVGKIVAYSSFPNGQVCRMSRWITVRFRSVGSAKRKLMLSLESGVGRYHLTSGADGEWTEQSFDALDPANAPLLPPLYSSEAITPYQGFVRAELSSDDAGAVFEVAAIRGSFRHEVALSALRDIDVRYAFAPGIPCVSIPLIADGMITGQLGGGFTTNDILGYVYAHDQRRTAPAPGNLFADLWTITDLAPQTEADGGMGILRSTLPGICLAGSGIVGGSVWREQIATIDEATGTASVAIPAQLTITAPLFYNGAGDISQQGGGYGYATTIHLSAVVRSDFFGVVWARQKSTAANLTLRASTAAADSTPDEVGVPRPGSGYITRAGKGLRARAVTVATSGAVTIAPRPGDVTSSAGPKKTVAFPIPAVENALIPQSIYELQTPLPPLANALPGGAAGATGPGGYRSSLRPGTRAGMLLYAALRQIISRPRNRIDPATGEYGRVWCDVTENVIRFRSARAVPDAAGLWQSPVAITHGSEGGVEVSYPDLWPDATRRLWALWQQDGGPDADGRIYEARSDDAGKTWSAGTMLGTGQMACYASDASAGGMGGRLIVRFVPVAGGAGGNLVFTAAAAGIAADAAHDVTAKYQAAPGAALTPLVVTDDGFDLVFGREGPGRLVLACTLVGTSEIVELACADGTATAFTFKPLPAAPVS